MGCLHQDGIEMAFEDEGQTSGEAILLLAGNGCSSTYWPEEFRRPLLTAGYRVIRYDYRDTGRSTHREFAAHPYTLDDLEGDAVGLLDHLGLKAVHLVGLSMGGFLAQRIAIRHPSRIRTLVSLMSTPDYDTMLHTFMGTAAPKSDLPPPRSDWLESLGRIPAGLSPLELSLEAWRLANGTKALFERGYWLKLIEAAGSRGHDEAAAHNHRAACAGSTDRYQLEQMKSLKAPSLFIQGSEDPIFPPAHAQRSAQAVPRGQSLVIEGMGHALNPVCIPELCAAILGWLRRSW